MGGGAPHLAYEYLVSNLQDEMNMFALTSMEVKSHDSMRWILEHVHSDDEFVRTKARGTLVSLEEFGDLECTENPKDPKDPKDPEIKAIIYGYIQSSGIKIRRRERAWVDAKLAPKTLGKIFH